MVFCPNVRDVFFLWMLGRMVSVFSCGFVIHSGLTLLSKMEKTSMRQKRRKGKPLESFSVSSSVNFTGLSADEE